MGPIQNNIGINFHMGNVCALMTPKVIDQRAKLYGFAGKKNNLWKPFLFLWWQNFLQQHQYNYFWVTLSHPCLLN